MIILASNSPRRKELLQGLGIDFKVLVIPGIDESYPDDLPAEQIAEHIAIKKSVPYQVQGTDNVVITADTIVVCEGEVMGKPADAAEAKIMLRKLSGKTHQVYTGVCVKSEVAESHFSVCTSVTFKKLDDSEIDYYINEYKPFDKAGAYGIQEWIGYVGITGIEGSYYNVMGFPVQRVYEELRRIGRI